MMFEISFYGVIVYAQELLFSSERLFKARVSHGYKKSDCYWGLCPGYKSYKDINDAYEAYNNAQHKLWAICEVTGISSDVAMTAARYYIRHGNACKWERDLNEANCKRLIELLSTPEPEWDGVYRNPLTESALNRRNPYRLSQWL